MAVSLKKGGRLSLTKERPGLKKVIVGAGWDPAKFMGIFGKKIDCDASAILCRHGRFCSSNDLVYFGHGEHASGAVKHLLGDNTTGEGDGDDERILVDLTKLPKDVDKVIIVINIYKGKERRQTFDRIKNAFIRIMDADNEIPAMRHKDGTREYEELIHFNLSENTNFSGMYSVIAGSIYLHNGEWRFEAIGEGSEIDNIHTLTEKFM